MFLQYSDSRKRKFINVTHSERQLSLGEVVNLVEHRVTSSFDVSTLADRVELAPGRQWGEHLSSVKVDALRVLVFLETSAGNAEGDRATPSCILKDRYEPQYLAGSDRRLRVMGPQISVLWKTRTQITAATLFAYSKYTKYVM